MKLLFDFLPIILFFGTFKFAEGRKEWAAQFASDHLGFIVSGGVVGPDEAPVLLATVVVIFATLAQVAFLVARGKKVDMMLWVSLGLVTVLLGPVSRAATLWSMSLGFSMSAGAYVAGKLGLLGELSGWGGALERVLPFFVALVVALRGRSPKSTAAGPA